jgi:hypothetical protein
MPNRRLIGWRIEYNKSSWVFLEIGGRPTILTTDAALEEVLL